MASGASPFTAGKTHVARTEDITRHIMGEKVDVEAISFQLINKFIYFLLMLERSDAFGCMKGERTRPYRTSFIAHMNRVFIDI